MFNIADINTLPMNKRYCVQGTKIMVVVKETMRIIVNDNFVGKKVTYKVAYNKRMHDVLVTENDGFVFFPLFKDDYNIVFAMEYKNFTAKMDYFTNPSNDNLYVISIVNDLAYVFTNDEEFVNVDFQQQSFATDVIITKYSEQNIDFLEDIISYQDKFMYVKGSETTVLNTYIIPDEDVKYNVTIFHTKEYADYFKFVEQLKELRNPKYEHCDIMGIATPGLDGYIIKLYERIV